MCQRSRWLAAALVGLVVFLGAVCHAQYPDLERLVEGNTTFAFDLYRELVADDENLFFSPYSISSALAMAYAGARGETDSQMADVLHFSLGQEWTHPTFHDLDRSLMSQERFADNPDSDPFRLNLANSLWGQSGYPLLSDYLSLLENYYGSELYEADFVADPEVARKTINAWVSDETEAKIPELIKQGMIGRATWLVLANAVYFNAAWQMPFDEDFTEDAPFTTTSGFEVAVPFMHDESHYRYTAGPCYQAVELAYANSSMAMTIVLPASGAFDAVEAGLDAYGLSEISQSMDRELVSLALPKFSFRSAFLLGETLSGMGMPLAFGDDADFSGIDGTDAFFIGNVIHEAFIAVDERGTEAAAATAVIMAGGAPMEPPVPFEFTADRPFLFLIRDTETGTILFMGRVMDPSPID